MWNFCQRCKGSRESDTALWTSGRTTSSAYKSSDLVILFVYPHYFSMTICLWCNDDADKLLQKVFDNENFRENTTTLAFFRKHCQRSKLYLCEKACDEDLLCSQLFLCSACQRERFVLTKGSVKDKGSTYIKMIQFNNVEKKSYFTLNFAYVWLFASSLRN